MNISEALPSRLDIVPEFIARTLEKIKALSIEDDLLFNIKLSLEEAVVNAIRHGNKENPELPVEVRIENSSGRIIITVKDKGSGFDFSRIPDPTEKKNIDKPSGRGVHLIRHLMDEVEYFDSGSGIRMVKFLRQGTLP